MQCGVMLLAQNVHVPATNMKWKKGFTNIFLSFFFLATEHRRILIRFLSILQSYHLNFTLEKYSEHVIFSIIFLNVPCAYLLYFLSSPPPSPSPSSSSSSSSFSSFWGKSEWDEKRARQRRNLNRIEENFLSSSSLNR